MKQKNPATPAPDDSGQVEHLWRMAGMVENAPTNMMFADREFVIRYINPASYTTLKTIEEHLPVTADEIVGSSLDIFHKNPAYQRGILKDDTQLPRRAYIQVGPETLDLLVSAIHDRHGDYVGAMATWEVVTQKLDNERMVTQLTQMMENAPTNMMFADHDLVIRYINPASLTTLATLEAYLPVKATEIVGSSLDIFHKNPSYQRDILKDDTQLPRRANIQVGPEILDLLVSPIHDQTGKYTGAMATWEVVTEKLRQEAFAKEAKLNADAISAVVEALNEASTLQEVEARALQAICRVYDMQYGILYSGLSGKLVMESDYGSVAEPFLSYVRTAQLDRGQGIAGGVWASGKARYIEDLQEINKQFAPGPIETAGIRETFSIPLVVNGEIGGVMNFHDRDRGQASEQRLVALDAIGKMVAQSLYGIMRENTLREENERTAVRVQRILDDLTKIAGGDLTVTIDDAESDNVGEVANAIDGLVVAMRTSLQEIEITAEALAESAGALTTVAQSMGAGAAATAELSTTAQSSSAEVSSSIQTVASATEEMTASIREIARNASDASVVAQDASQSAFAAQATVAELGTSSAEIGEVIKVITSIAQQTNLLALNATIEAARAGDAGKGFAVVANEVKELAKETATATESISQKIEAIQGSTGNAVGAISRISEVIGQINDIQSTIAAAVEEQSATTNEIARTITDVVGGVTQIAEGAVEVVSAATESQRGAQETLDSAEHLNQVAAELKQLVGKYTLR